MAYALKHLPLRLIPATPVLGAPGRHGACLAPEHCLLVQRFEPGDAHVRRLPPRVQDSGLPGICVKLTRGCPRTTRNAGGALDTNGFFLAVFEKTAPALGD